MLVRLEEQGEIVSKEGLVPRESLPASVGGSRWTIEAPMTGFSLMGVSMVDYEARDVRWSAEMVRLFFVGRMLSREWGWGMQVRTLLCQLAGDE